MSGLDFTFNKAKGKVAYIVEDLVNAGTGRIIVLLLIDDAASGVTLESGGDDTMKDHDTLASLLSANTEAQPDSGTPSGARVTNYVRKYLTGSSDSELGASPNDMTESMDVDSGDIVWSLLGNGSYQHVIGKLVYAFDPAHNNTTAGTETDSACLPLTAHSFDVTPDGSNISALVTLFYKAIDG